MSHAIRANRQQMFLLPPSMDEWLPKDHPARFVAELVEQLPLVELGFRQSPGEEGRPHYATEVVLSVWLFGWMERVRSSRGLEKACRRDMAFIWLTGNLQPDHNTLWRFFRSNKAALKKLFKRVVQIAAKAGLVGFALHALDGTKMKAVSSMESTTHRKQLMEKLKELDAIVERGVDEIERAEQASEPSWQMPETLKDPKARREAIAKALATLDEADTDHLHEKEADARMMKLRGGGIGLGYNAQAVVDHRSDLVVGIDVVNDATDHAQLTPMLLDLQDTCGRVADETVADAGYASGEQFELAERKHLPVLVNVQEESSMKGPFAKSNFTYDRERDVYICPRGEVLELEGLHKASGGKAARKVYRCHKTDCPVRAQCTEDKKGRTIKRQLTEEAFDRQVEKQSSSEMVDLLRTRKQIVEHIFGIVKTIDGFARFTARGLEAARAQWALACTALNLRKLLAAWRAGTLVLAPAKV